MSASSINLTKYDLITLKNPYFLSDIKDIVSSNSNLSSILDNLHSSFIFKHSEPSSQASNLESSLYSFAKDILKVSHVFFSKQYDYRHEFIEQANIFLYCEKFYLENQKPVKSTLSTNDIFAKYTPFFVRILHFLEAFHSNLVMKNKDVIFFEVDESVLLFPLLETSSFLDDLGLIFTTNLKKLTSFLAKFPEEKALLLRIYNFISFIKTLSFSQNLQNSEEQFSHQKLDQKVKDIIKKLSEKTNLDIRGIVEDSETPSKILTFFFFLAFIKKN